MTSIVDAAPPWLVGLDDDDAVADVPDATVWNLRGMEAWWRLYPDSMDFLNPAADTHALKALQTRLYREALGDALPGAGSAPLRILDAACGIGRFAVPLAAAGHTVHGVDACRTSLERAARHGAGRTSLRLTWTDVGTLDTLDDDFPDGSYDLVLAFELLCYVHDPVAVAASLGRKLKPGGRLVGSLEAWPGALLSDATGVTVESLSSVLETRVVSEPNERWVRACDRPETTSILKDAGLVPRMIEGTHYIPDGPLAALLDHDRIGTSDYDDALCALEGRFRTTGDLGALPRAWLMVAERVR